MGQALAEAKAAAAIGEIPVGAILVSDEGAVFTAHNQKERQQDPVAHAEILALQAAARGLKRWRLGGTLYVTLEPCAMCAGALIQARVDRLVFGAFDLKAGACGSVIEVLREPLFNHRIEALGGVFAKESEHLLQDFFGRLREKKSLRC